jgi:hypothetical protein
MQWSQHLYIDGMLPFGLRSSPKIFSAVADALEWCIIQGGVQDIFHYLDDFLVMGPPGSSICNDNLAILLKVCAGLGVPLAPEKQEGPSPVLTFLGIIIDTPYVLHLKLLVVCHTVKGNDIVVSLTP